MLFDFIRAGVPLARTDRHRLAGTVTVDGAPAQRLVSVLIRDTWEQLAAKQSDAVTGAWEFYGLPEYPLRALMVISVDDEPGTHNAEIADFVSQVTG
ncbi:MAG: hypothetical protein JZU65_08535 [Chlorobium sp.]|nr:hypothetical protein [Chlorobium sp.]